MDYTGLFASIRCKSDALKARIPLTMRGAFANYHWIALVFLFSVSFCCRPACAADLLLAECGLKSGEMYYFAIMGEVAQPGVFESNEPDLQLLELVSRAGGATSAAAGNIRIIREGRAGEQAYLAPRLNFPLRPNDVVILDAWPSRVEQGFGDSRTELAAGIEPNGWTEMPRAPVIQLGLVNAASRPVILDVSPEEATLGAVLSLLHQSRGDNRHTMVIRPLGGASR